jgi:hypothetical protein
LLQQAVFDDSRLSTPSASRYFSQMMADALSVLSLSRYFGRLSELIAISS